MTAPSPDLGAVSEADWIAARAAQVARIRAEGDRAADVDENGEPRRFVVFTLAADGNASIQPLRLPEEPA